MGENWARDESTIQEEIRIGRKSWMAKTGQASVVCVRRVSLGLDWGVGVYGWCLVEVEIVDQGKTGQDRITASATQQHRRPHQDERIRLLFCPASQLLKRHTYRQPSTYPYTARARRRARAVYSNSSGQPANGKRAQNSGWHTVQDCSSLGVRKIVAQGSKVGGAGAAHATHKAS
jgi:hypothetical protein